MFGQSLLSAFGIACTTDTDQLFATDQSVTSTATYQLNNATTSIPSNTYPGTASNITYAAGKFGDAAVFNGSSSYISLPSGINKNNDFSWSFWINFNSFTLYDTPIGFFMNGYTNYIDVYNVNGQLSFYDGQSRLNTPGSTFATGSWYHVAVTKSSTNGRKFYVNGSEVASNSSNSNSGSSSGGRNLLGAYSSSGNPTTALLNVDGKIDQVRIFNTALPQAAITALYNETATTATSASIDYQLANPNSVAYYKMSDTTDQLGNYNGTATNVNFNTEGKFGFAGNFSGSTSSYMEIPSGINKNNDFSWSFWINFNSFLSYYDCPIGFFTNGCDNYIRSNSTGDIRFYDGNSFLVPPSNSVSAGSWYHIVVTKSSTTGRKMYINGSVAASDSSTSNSSGGGGGRNLFGGYSSSGNPTTSAFPFDGKLDQIRIYDSAISAADVTTLYKEIECQPASINALANFNTVLYTGDGSAAARNITTGFKPGLTWIKGRNTSGKWNVLYDALRGPTNMLSSNVTNAAQTYGSVTPFGTGFTLATTGGDLNTSGEDYVSWNWKAPLDNLSTNFYTSSSGIEVSQTLLGSGSTKIFSISFWFKTSSNNEQYFINTGAASTNTGIGIYVNPTNGYLRYQTSNGGGSASSGPYLSLEDRDLQDGKWHHVVATYSSAGGTNNAYTYLYVDGQDVTSLCTGKNSWTQGGAATWSSFTIPKIVFGKWADGNFYNTVGNLAQVRFFSDIVTSGEVSDLYTEPAASNNTLNYPAGAGCIAAYPLQTDAVDLSGNYSGASSNVTFGQPGYLTQNTDGAITSTVAANQEAGFSIATWSGNGTASNIGHGLGGTPELIIIKNRTGTNSWIVGVPEVLGVGYLMLNNSGSASSSNVFGQVPDSTKYYFNTAAGGNGHLSSGNYVCYFFRSIPGYSKIGSYIGTAAAGNFQYTGFQPSWLMVKCSSASGRDWVIFDDKRISGSSYYELYPNTSGAENGPYPDVTLNSTGFTLGSNASFSNGSGDTYIYLAIA